LLARCRPASLSVLSWRRRVARSGRPEGLLRIAMILEANAVRG
jgi:hypothetical protein